MSAPGNDKALPSSAQKAPPFQGGSASWNPLLEGDYIYSGPATCLFSSTGFTDFRPNPGGNPFVQNYMVNGKATFDGNGNGTLSANSLAVNQFALGTPVTFQIDFTYQVNSDLTITILDLDSTATTLSTPPQQSSVSGVAPLMGRVSEDRRTIQVMHYARSVETIKDANENPINYRVCTRERTFTRISAQ